MAPQAGSFRRRDARGSSRTSARSRSGPVSGPRCGIGRGSSGSHPDHRGRGSRTATHLAQPKCVSRPREMFESVPMNTNHHIAMQFAAERQRELRASSGRWSLADLFSRRRSAQRSFPRRALRASSLPLLRESRTGRRRRDLARRRPEPRIARRRPAAPRRSGDASRPRARASPLLAGPGRAGARPRRRRGASRRRSPRPGSPRRAARAAVAESKLCDWGASGVDGQRPQLDRAEHLDRDAQLAVVAVAPLVEEHPGRVGDDDRQRSPGCAVPPRRDRSGTPRAARRRRAAAGAGVLARAGRGSRPRRP